MIHRLMSVPLSPTAFHKEKGTIEFIARKNNMHLDINHMIRKKAISHTPARTTFHSRDNDTKEKKIIRLRFLGDLSFKLARVLQTFGFHAAFHPVDATKKIFSKLKDPIPPDEKSAVYKLQWGD